MRIFKRTQLAAMTQLSGSLTLPAVTKAGFFFGGGIAGSESSEIDAIRFSTEAAYNPTAALSTGRYGCAGLSS